LKSGRKLKDSALSSGPRLRWIELKSQKMTTVGKKTVEFISFDFGF